MKKILPIILVILIYSTGTAMAATEENITASVEKGLEWLANQQNADGSWYGGGDDRDIGATGLVLLKFEEYAKEQGYKPTDPAYEYSDNVTKGLEFLDGQLKNLSVGAGYDGNSNGNMTYLGDFTRTYLTSVALMAYSANPDSSPDMVQDLTDWLVNAQCNDSSNLQYGVWDYMGFVCSGDNSNTGYATLGLGYALNAGATIPANTTIALSSYVDYIQNDPGIADNGIEDDPDGGSGYTSPGWWVNSLKTGNLIFEAVLSGDAVDSSRILNATDYLYRHWNDDIEGWKGNLSATPNPYNTQYQATYTIMKGLEAIGKEDLNGIDWFDEMSTAIVNDQQADGNWTQCPNYIWQDGYAVISTDELCTAWAMLTLEKVTPIKGITVSLDVKPGSCPNPINVDSKGVLPVAIAGTETLDVMDINTSTIMLGVFNSTSGTIDNPIPPIIYNYSDVTEPYIPGEEDPCCIQNMNDSIMDLVMHFDMQELVDAGLDSYVDKEGVYLGIIGETMDGREIAGKDCVWIKESKKK